MSCDRQFGKSSWRLDTSFLILLRLQSNSVMFRKVQLAVTYAAFLAEINQN
jgi:hypothetical protein